MIQKIDAYHNGCMLYYKDDKDEDACRFCGVDRYKACGRGKSVGTRKPTSSMHYLPLMPRLQRLFMVKETAENMSWHKREHTEGVLDHPSDGEAWKHFDREYPDFASDPRNVRLGLCSDGFTPFGLLGSQYSCWPVIVTPYNLPPWMCMKTPYMFLTVIIPGPNNPKRNIDVYLQPLIDELNQLWEVGSNTYDVSRKQNFQMRAALMWTINDFPAYGMLSGWSTHGRLSCPCCMDDTKAFRLKHGGKPCFFDCHRQFLPKDHPYRRNMNTFCARVVEKVNLPPKWPGYMIWEEVKDLPRAIEEPAMGYKFDGFGRTHDWTKRSIL